MSSAVAAKLAPQAGLCYNNGVIEYCFGPALLRTTGAVTNERFGFIRMDSLPQNVPQDNPSQKKRCSKCRQWLPFNAFNGDKRSRTGLQYWCKACNAKCKKETMTLEKQRDWDLRKHYGIRIKHYNQMLEQQGGVCAVCKMPETRIDFRTGVVVPLHVDHDHNTGDVRALLCGGCNAALGHMKEDPERIRALAKYAEWCKNREPDVKLIQHKLFEKD